MYQVLNILKEAQTLSRKRLELPVKSYCVQWTTVPDNEQYSYVHLAVWDDEDNVVELIRPSPTYAPTPPQHKKEEPAHPPSTKKKTPFGGG